MRRKVRPVFVAFLLLTGSNARRCRLALSRGIGSTRLNHNQSGSSSSTTVMENRAGTEVGTTSTHNPTSKKDYRLNFERQRPVRGSMPRLRETVKLTRRPGHD